MKRFRSETGDLGLSFWLLAAQLAVAAGGFLVNIISARALGAEGRGELALLLQITYVVGAVAILGRDRSYLATLHQKIITNPLATREFVSQLRFPVIIVLAASFLIGVGLGPSEWKISALLGGGALLVLLSNCSNLTLRSTSIASNSGRGYTVAMIAGQSSLVMVSFALAYFEVTAIWKWLLAYGGCIFLPIVTVLSFRLLHRYGQPRESKELIEFRRLGYKLLPSTFAQMLMTRFDRLLLPIFAGYGALGLYVVVATMTELVHWPVKQFVDARIPVWRYRISRSEFSIREPFLTVGSLAVALMTIVGIATWILLPILFGPEFESSRQLVLPLVLAAGTHALSLFSIGVSVAFGKANVASAISITGLVLASAFYFFLIPTYGALGAAWASLLGYMGAAIIGMFHLSRSFKGGGATVEESNDDCTTDE